MFRPTFTQEKKETLFFDAWMRRIEGDALLRVRADAMLHAASTMEPLIADTLRTPQDIRYHAEGPFVRDHLRLMLMSIYAVAEGKASLLEIEELARMKGYETEIEGLEELFKEHVAWFEAFALCHDAAKWACTAFKSKEESRGAQLGFNTVHTYEPDIDLAEQMKMRTAYLDLYQEFATTHAQESPQEIQSLFYQTYEIDVKYPFHDRMIHAPLYEALLQRFIVAHEMIDIHGAMLTDIISHHLRFEPFAVAEKSLNTMKQFFYLADKRGYDTENFIDFIQGAVFFDFVCASKRSSPHGSWHEIEMMVHALRAEHDRDPMQRVEKQRAREVHETRQRNRWFQEVGLDGIALLDVLDMEPGPQFGKMLKQIQGSVIGRNEMPSVGKKIDAELQKRVQEYYQKAFEKGD
ncbi:MAG: hypothetical protein AAB431_02780 [Patescibacteria group bacterium]